MAVAHKLRFGVPTPNEPQADDGEAQEVLRGLVGSRGGLTGKTVSDVDSHKKGLCVKKVGGALPVWKHNTPSFSHPWGLGRFQSSGGPYSYLLSYTLYLITQCSGTFSY